MVDIIRPCPYAPSLFSTNIYNQRTKFPYQPLDFASNSFLRNPCSDFDRSNLLQSKRWIGNCANNPPRLLDVSNQPYSIHRKIMYQELSRHFPAKIDSFKSTQNKEQQSTTKERPKTPAPVTSQGSFVQGDAQNSRLFETLSKHVTIKPEPIRPSNSFLNSSTNTLTSWQKYWSSTHTQRRRKEANEHESSSFRLKREATLPGQTHFVVLRDSPMPTCVIGQNVALTPTLVSHTPVESEVSGLSDKTVTESLTEESNTKKTSKEKSAKKQIHTISTIEFVGSSFIPSSVEFNSCAMPTRISIMHPVKINRKPDDKEFIDKSSFVSSSQFKSDSEIIEEVSQAQFQSKPVTTKVYKLAVTEDKSKERMSRPPQPSSRKIRSKSKEKAKQKTRISSPPKQHRPISSGKKPKHKCDLSETMMTTSKLKFSQTKWDEPYVGVRFDPPTPPCSPSLSTWLDDSDADDDCRLYEKSEIMTHYLVTKN